MSLIFVIALVVVGWLLYKQYFKALLSQGKVGQLKIFLVALGLIFLFMAVTGRAHAVFALIGAALTMIMRFAPLLVRFLPMLKSHLKPTSAGASGGGQSQVKTASLVMTLDHSTGTLDGQVLAGNYQGRRLQSLEIEELKVLLDYCNQSDPEAARLLMSYISRERAESWNAEHPGDSTENATGSASTGSMDREEALQILGLEGDITKASITQAHRSLMGKFHPDKGGNTYLATKLNNARDVLLSSIDS